MLGSSVAVVAVLAGASHVWAGLDIANFDAAQEADGHADTAALVMTPNNNKVPVLYAARRVAGDTGQTKIEVLRADGTTWSGHLTLRITVTKNQQSVSAESATRCYVYSFDQTSPEAAPHHRDECPPGPPLDLGPPPAFIDMRAPEQALRLAKLLNALSPEKRLDAAAVRSEVETAYPPPVVVLTGKVSNTVMQVDVRNDVECLRATVPATGPATVSPSMHGLVCTGG